MGISEVCSPVPAVALKSAADNHFRLEREVIRAVWAVHGSIMPRLSRNLSAATAWQLIKSHRFLVLCQ